MTIQAQPSPADSSASPAAIPQDGASDNWRGVRDDDDIQFDVVQIPDPEPEKPGIIEEALAAFFGWLGDVLAPVGGAIAYSWPVLQWVLLGLVAAFVLYMLFNTIGPLARNKRERRAAVEEAQWQPDREESLALLDDADRLASQGRYDEATHLLLQRSVGQIASARPDWVEPSSTARELAALPTLSDAARTAFATIASRVERSLFALRSLDRSDWEAARAAYADFALVKIGANAGPSA